jgi:hypothetical protein
MMQMLFDNDNFAVVYVDANAQAREAAVEHNAVADSVHSLHSRKSVRHIPLREIPEERHCYEIVDKRNNKEVMLHGSWAAAFAKQIEHWHQETPTEEEVEEVLDSFAFFAQLPMVVH